MPAQKLAVPALSLLILGLGVFGYSEYTARVAAEDRLVALNNERENRATADLNPPAPGPTPEPVAEPVASPADATPGPMAAPAVESRPGPTFQRAPGNYAAMMDTPEMQQLIALRARGQLDNRYADLFAKLRLSPEQLQRLQQLLVDKQNTSRDVMAAMRSQGLSPRRENAEQTRSLIQDANAEIDAQIRTELGEAVFAQYQEYERTQPQRTLVSRVQQRLSYSGEPLSEQQADLLVSLFAEAAPAPTSRGPGPPGTPSFRSAGITDDALARAGAVLSPTQLAALQQLHQEQEAQNQLMRRTRQGMNASGAPR